MELLTTANSQLGAFSDACAWSSEIDMCLSWLAPGDIQGPSWADLEPHLRKVRRAIVGLAYHRTDPALLARLYDLSVLRLVPTTDEAFLANLYVFRREERVRCLLASAPFTSTRFHRSIEHVVRVEATDTDPFVARVLALVERGAQAAHVPTRDELERYRTQWLRKQEVGPGDELDVGGDLFDDAALPGLVVVPPNTPAARKAQEQVLASLARSATRAYARARLAQADPHGVLTHCAPLRLWWILPSEPERVGFWARFGSAPPSSEHPDTIALELGRNQDWAFACEREAERLFLVHKNLALVSNHRCGIMVHQADGSDAFPAAVVGEVGAPDFAKHIAAFVHTVANKRADPALASTTLVAATAEPEFAGTQPPAESLIEVSPVTSARAEYSQPAAATTSRVESKRASSREPNTDPVATTFPAIRFFASHAVELRAVFEADAWWKLTRDQRLMTAEMSFVWLELSVRLRAVLQPEHAADLESALDEADAWEGEPQFAIAALTSKEIPGAKADANHVWFRLGLEPIETILGLRTCLVVSLQAPPLKASVRGQFLDRLSASLAFGTWDPAGAPFVPPKNISLRDSKLGSMDIALVDLTSIDSDDLDDFIERAVTTFRFGLATAIGIDRALGVFVQ